MSEAQSTPNSPHLPQYTLRHLFLGVTVLAVVLGLTLAIGYWSFAVLYVAGVLVAACFRWFSWTDAAAAVCVAVLVLMLLLPLSCSVSRDSPTARCNLRLKQLQVALQTYESIHGSYPPLVTYSPDSRPKHSWRALILDYFEHEPAADAYDFAEPWNSAMNARLGRVNISFFRCPADKRAPTGTVAYLAVAPPNYQPGDRFGLIEVPRSGIGFFEPRDLQSDELLLGKSRVAKGYRAPHGEMVDVHLPFSPGYLHVEAAELPETLARLFAEDAAKRTASRERTD